MKLKVKKLHKDAVIPAYYSEGASGFDICALDSISIYPLTCIPIRTGLAMEIPKGYELQIRPRSGLSLNTTLRIANSPGTIDSDYRGEICILVENTTKNQYGMVEIKRGQRIAQGILQKVERFSIEVVEELSTTNRGENGFGSTGMETTASKNTNLNKGKKA